MTDEEKYNEILKKIPYRKYNNYIKKYLNKYESDFLIYIVNKFYILHKKRLHVEDIYKYNPEKLFSFISKFNGIKTKSDIYKSDKKNVKNIFKNDDFKIVEILNKKQMEIYGLDSKWCISMKTTDKYFDDFKMENNIYLLSFNKKIKLNDDSVITDNKNDWNKYYYNEYYKEFKNIGKIYLYKYLILHNKINKSFQIIDQLNVCLDEEDFKPYLNLIRQSF